MANTIFYAFCSSFFIKICQQSSRTIIRIQKNVLFESVTYGQKYEFCAAIFVLGTDNFNYMWAFYFIYLRMNVPEPNGKSTLLIHCLDYMLPLNHKKTTRS